MPERVRRAVDGRVQAIGLAALQRAAEALSSAYRAGGGAPAHLTAAERTAAYLATRMPATYAAAHAVLREVRERCGAHTIASVLDIGSGTGAASLAVREYFPQARITMIERDAALSGAAREWLPDSRLIQDDVERLAELPPHDLVIAAYSLGEMRRPPIARVWDAARAILVVIEPGTPAGFRSILGVRGELLAAGARIAAPCPAEGPCPLPPSDWCHFAARVERSAIHRRMKRADLNYEDEKFAYVVLAREDAEPAPARVIRRPLQKPGLIVLETCAPDGLHTERVTKRGPFRAARRARWGDAWEISSSGPETPSD